MNRTLLHARTLMRAGRLITLACMIGILLPAGAAASKHPGPFAHQSIFGGFAAAQGQFPYVAWMDYSDSSTELFCSGTLVAPNIVMTAGHCVSDDYGRPLADSNMVVAIDAADLTTSPPGAVGRRVARVVRHPKFNRARLVYDVALLVLAKPVSLPVAALAADAQTRQFGHGGQVVAVGYGQKATGAEASLHLMYTSFVFA